MPLTYDHLRNAVSSLDKAIGLTYDHEFMGGLDEVAQEVFRAGLIQNFEFTYELCMKLIDAWLKSNVNPEYSSGENRRERYRIAQEFGLIADSVAWFAHHRARNDTSHIYDEEIAARVFADIPEFALDAKSLLKVLESQSD